MPIQKQLSVVMPNRPGILARTCAILADANVNVMALSVLDNNDNAVVRVLCDQPTKALLLLEQEELYVMEQDVVVVEIDNRPGELTRIAQILAQADINIQYAYATATQNQEFGCLVLKTDEPEKALSLLSGGFSS